MNKIMAYRIKHIKTGLYYQPIGSSGNNLSTRGKIYHSEKIALSVLKSNHNSLTLNKESRVYSIFKEITGNECIERKWHRNSILIKTNIEDFEVEKLIIL